MSEDIIQVARDGYVVRIKVVGRGTYQCSQSLRDVCSRLLKSKVSKILIDLAECITMDSTFMGVLAMFGVRGKKKNLPFEILNIDGKKKRLLTGLGLGKLFVFPEQAKEDNDWKKISIKPNCKDNPTNQKKQAEIMLKAHEALVNVDPENEMKFKDVIEFLKEDINKLS